MLQGVPVAGRESNDNTSEGYLRFQLSKLNQMVLECLLITGGGFSLDSRSADKDLKAVTPEK